MIPRFTLNPTITYVPFKNQRLPLKYDLHHITTHKSITRI